MGKYDVLGNVVIYKFDRGLLASEKKKIALAFLKRHKSVRTFLEKSDKFKGRLRTLTAKYIAGDKTKEALHRELGSVFRLNVESCYFSPRLSGERKEVAKKVKKGEDVLVMFGGVAPFAIAIAKHSKAGRVVSVELGRECNRYAKDNVKRNKVDVELVQGDVRRRIPDLKGKFDRIVMARPNLKDSFLDVAFKKIKKGGTIYYYGFYQAKEARSELKKLIESEAKKARKKVRILKIKKAGDIAPYKYRYRVDIKVS